MVKKKIVKNLSNVTATKSNIFANKPSTPSGTIKLKVKTAIPKLKIKTATDKGVSPSNAVSTNRSAISSTKGHRPTSRKGSKQPKNSPVRGLKNHALPNADNMFTEKLHQGLLNHKQKIDQEKQDTMITDSLEGTDRK